MNLSSYSCYSQANSVTLKPRGGLKMWCWITKHSYQIQISPFYILIQISDHLFHLFSSSYITFRSSLNKLSHSRCIAVTESSMLSVKTLHLQVQKSQLRNLSQLHSLTRVCFLLFSRARSFSSIDALDTFILRVKRRFEVGLGLVQHSHPLQGKVAAPYEIGTHLTGKKKRWIRGWWGEKEREFTLWGMRRRWRLKQRAKTRRPINSHSVTISAPSCRSTPERTISRRS